MLIVLAFMLAVYAVAGYIFEQQDKKRLKMKIKKNRHRKDKSMQQAADDMDRLYRDLILKEICK